MEQVNDALFLAINASAHPDPRLLALAFFFADYAIYAVPLLLAGLWLWGNSEDRSGLLVASCAGVVALLVNGLIALTWFHPRPAMVPIGHTFLEHAPDSSFPSDHVTLMWAVGSGLVLGMKRRRAGLFLLGLSLPVAWARVFLGVHFPLDMAGAFIVGGGCAMLLAPTRPLFVHIVTPKLAEPIYHRLFDTLIRRGWVRP